MIGSLARHSFGAILLAVVLEETGIPMPIPTDLMIVFAGTTADRSLSKLSMFYVALTAASAVGASGLYAMVRRGGRPLVDRFGRYVHLGPERLSRAENLLSRTGWWGIALGRAIPGLRYATVIACGLLKVSYPRFLTAHIAGSSVYIIAFLALGSIFGTSIVDRIHLPARAVHLLLLVPLAVGPSLFAVWATHRLGRRPGPSPRPTVGAALLGSAFGAISMAATLSAVVTVAEVFGAQRPVSLAQTFVGWPADPDSTVNAVSVLLYAVLLVLLAATGAVYQRFVLPYLAPDDTSRPRQVAGLALLTAGTLGLAALPTVLATPDDTFVDWWQAGGSTSVLGVACGIAVYALTSVYGRTLTMAVAPVFHGREDREPA